MSRLSTPIFSAFFLLACGLLFCAALDHARLQAFSPPARPTSLQEPSLSISASRRQLRLTGTTASADHERSLLQLADEQFAGTLLRSDFHPGVITPEAWVSASERLLYALATAESAEAIMQPGSISIRAVTSDAEAMAVRLADLRDTTSADFEIDSDVIVVDATTPFEQLCLQVFSQLLLEPVSFRQSSYEIRASSFVTLDRVTDFANDCPHVNITITGHTDASGDESWNRQLSLSRAQAVADYIVRGGTDPQRLIVQGAGSTEPIADNTTAQGRGLNRRIEFALQ